MIYDFINGETYLQHRTPVRLCAPKIPHEKKLNKLSVHIFLYTYIKYIKYLFIILRKKFCLAKWVNADT